MGISRVTKKLVPQLGKVDGAILVLNATDPQFATFALFASAVSHVPNFIVLNKCDRITETAAQQIAQKFPGRHVIFASMLTGRGIDEVRARLREMSGRVIVLGIFNCLSGDTEIIAKTSADKHGYRRYTLRELSRKKSRKKSPRSMTLLSHNPSNGEIVTSQATLFPSGNNSVYRITLEDGRTVDANENHRLFVLREDKLVEQVVNKLKVGESILAEDEEDISAWLSSVTGRGCFTEGALIQMRKRTSRRNTEGLASKAGKASSEKHGLKNKIENDPILKKYYQDHMRSIQHLSPKGSYRKGRTLEECYGKERSDKIKRSLSEAWTGEKNPMARGIIPYPKPRFVDDLGHSVRSSWEEEICRILRYSEIEYEYEPELIKFYVNGKLTWYTPDIRISNGFYIEPHGPPLTDWQLTKLRTFIGLGYKLILITGDNHTKELKGAYTYHLNYDNASQLPELITSINTDCLSPNKIINIEHIGIVDTYDITAPKFENFFLANGVLSHNSGKSSLINKLTGSSAETGSIPGTTLEFTEYSYNGSIMLVDSVGQIIDISKPLIVSIDLSMCKNTAQRLRHCFVEEVAALMPTIESAMTGLLSAVKLILSAIEKGNKVVTVGAGASALVAMEMAGQGQETGVPIMCFTNNLAQAQPISFAKGTEENEEALAQYICRAIAPGDVVIGISASGGTGFVYRVLEISREIGAHTIAITENSDTPLGYAADIIIKSEAKPEGPSSSKIQTAHLAIGHALLITLAEERGITAEQSINYMLPTQIPSKLMGIK